MAKQYHLLVLIGNPAYEIHAGEAILCEGTPFYDNGEHHIRTPGRGDFRICLPTVFLADDPLPDPEFYYGWGNEPDGYVSTYCWRGEAMVNTGFRRRADLPETVKFNCPYP